MLLINDHYELSSKKGKTKNEVATVLGEHWNNSLKKSEDIVHNLWESLK